MGVIRGQESVKVAFSANREGQATVQGYTEHVMGPGVQATPWGGGVLGFACVA